MQCLVKRGQAPPPVPIRALWLVGFIISHHSFCQEEEEDDDEEQEEQEEQEAVNPQVATDREMRGNLTLT